MNVGISVFASPGSNVWSSGVNQNIAFLVHLLRHSPGVGGIYLVNGGDGDALPEGMADALPGVPLVRPADVTHKVDVVIEMGAQLPLEWMKHVRALGAKLVLFVVGHTYAMAAENPLFGRTGGLTFTGAPWHEVWTLPQYMDSCAPMLRTLARVPVHAVPHIWSPAFLERSIAAGGQAFGFDLGSRSPRAGWRVGIFEPNISVVKNGMVPMLACEQAYRTNRGAIDTMMVMNSLHMKEHPSFNTLAAGLDLVKDGRASFEPRVAFAECMGRFRLDAVVSHQWENAQNYLYYDALHGGYPLVHNSPFLRDAGAGLFYDGFDALGAARALLGARDEEPGYWREYRTASRAFLATLAPDRAENVAAFRRRLAA
ncbi:DUF2827 domain-containing protein [Ramlibacter albus]|uniref:DUF2827 domain-containing protein n=1 Tax=Ramlibacter albus TaxID=2079448 RepID=A0A923S0S6_9BURK|nr:DUF2827 domain-containing protein [Ramlibacter albus]MBC5763565.1 DUF2827 domain-containing protein [Ramlibacter albus]